VDLTTPCARRREVAARRPGAGVNNRYRHLQYQGYSLVEEEAAGTAATEV
jgi:hypothetical protein